MKIVIAPDKFKGSLTANEVCEALSLGISSVLPNAEIVSLPMADGGEGSLAAISKSIEADEVEIFVKDPLFRTIIATYLRKGDTAYIEMAAASGLHLLIESERNPEYGTTYGTGQLIKHAVKNGVREVNLFVGGSATNDGGIGMAQSLGYRFLDENDEELLTVAENLNDIRKIVLPENPLEFKMNVLCDVQNPLYGPNGASHIYGPQKGADEATVLRLDAGLKNLAAIIKKGLGKDVANIPGAGAAGGIAAGAVAFCKATIVPGIESVMQIVGFEKKVKDTDLIITGEGKMDQQTLSGKLISGIAKAANTTKTPLIAVCGLNEISKTEYQNMGVHKVYALVNERVSKEEAILNAKQLLQNEGEKIALTFF